MKLEAFIEALRMESLGFNFGEPWTYDEKSISCVLPIIRTGTDELPVTFLTSIEAKDFLEIKDKGQINTMYMRNKGELPIFIRAGEVLKGDTQTRSIVTSFILFPSVKEIEEGKVFQTKAPQFKPVDVRCIYAGKGIVSGTSVFCGTYASGKDMYFLNERAKGGVDQSGSWQDDKAYSRTVGSTLFAASAGRPEFVIPSNKMKDIQNFTNFGTDDINMATETAKDVLSDIARKCPLIDNQIGIALIDTNGFHSLECYNLHSSWKSVSEEVVGKESLKIAEKDDSGVFQYKPEKANDVIKKVLVKGYDKKEEWKEEAAITYLLDFEKHIGEATVLDDVLIHLLIGRKV